MRSAEASVEEIDRTVSAGPEAEWVTLPVGPRTATGGEARPARAQGRGDVVGRYVVLSLIGAGGMGAVYAAHDPELDRKIALKLVRPGADPSDGVRMLREARALAKLAHPNVVAVHDVGTVGAEADSVELFIAMEFVDGVTVRQWLRERERSLREIVDVFAGAARGLAAAHRVGLVHRDFKPDNVMVAADGRARVMDFGLARAWAEGETTLPDGSGGPLDMRLTRAGSRIGTPMYMAPEQWEGDEVDARTDQFAFCVALWEAVYGERPFRGESMQELMSSVTTGMIAKPPERRRRSAPKWLAHTLERGLARRPEQRFASMEALLVELERGIARQRRRPLLAGVAAIGVIAAGMFGLQAQRAAGCEAEGASIAELWHEGSRSALLQALRATGLPFAETSYHKATPHFDRWTNEWSQLRTRVCKESKVEGSRTPASYKAAAACLDEQREALAAVLEVFTAHPQANVQRLVSAAAGLAQLQPCAEQSYLERRPAPPEDPTTRERVRALQKEVLLTRGRLAAGDCSGLARAEALEQEAEGLGYRPLAVIAIDLVGDLAECNDDYARAEQALKKVYVEAEALRADELAAGAAIELVATIGLDRSRAAEALQWALPAEVIVRRLGQQRGLLAARLSQSKAMVLLSLGEHAKALAEMESALAIREELLGPDHPAVATTLELIGNIHRAREALDAALAVQTRALQIRREALGADHPGVGTSANNLGLLEQQRGNYEAARSLLTEAIRVAEGAFGPEDLEVATALNNLGRLQHVRGEYEEARALLGRALAIREKKLGPDALDVAVTLQNLGLLELIQGERIAARSRLERVLKIRERKLDEAHPELVAILDSLGTLNYRIGDYSQAEALHERALAIQRKLVPAEHPDIASSLRNLALVRHARGAREEALGLAREALAAAERALGPEHPDVAPFLNTLGLLQRRTDPAAAVATLERALAISARARGKRHPATATSLVRLGEAHLARGEHQAAQASLEEGLSIRETLGMHTPEVAEALVGLGELALARGRAAEAVPLFERALQIREKPGIPAHQLAEARFGLARALEGDPGRARSLAEQAAAGLRGDDAQREQVAAIEAWLRGAGR